MLAFLKTAAGYLRPYWRQALLIVLSQAPAAAFITLQPLLLRALLDDAIVPGNAALAALLIAAMVGLLLLHALGDLANHYLVARVVASVMSDLRLRILRISRAYRSASTRGRGRAICWPGSPRTSRGSSACSPTTCRRRSTAPSPCSPAP